MSLCPESEYRASLTDGEFWEYVLLGVRPGEVTDDDESDMDAITAQTDPCPECGERGACGYDNEGRAMVHVTEAEVER